MEKIINKINNMKKVLNKDSEFKNFEILENTKTRQIIFMRHGVYLDTGNLAPISKKFLKIIANYLVIEMEKLNFNNIEIITSSILRAKQTGEIIYNELISKEITVNLNEDALLNTGKNINPEEFVNKLKDKDIHLVISHQDILKTLVGAYLETFETKIHLLTGEKNI